MISSLLLYLKFFPTTEESIDHYNQKRCFDGKGLVQPSQIRYIKYFECILTYFNGENPPGRSWLNTTMMENRKVFTNNDLDGFDKNLDKLRIDD
ncbi:dual-specificity protein phosphatase PTEN [Pyrus ussuriensis x Pyrus communis]|uniref:Dual-specificity protein phosphatase PTEN n=1 Tax=Pyrus ussuriensis x Pyrus communis TaxID=2448454 RepID=A0A5N5FIX6_9ROSA|nr:dual-specificity protein phosphatase PTEN [Pyrus ussuriensis x Pyrus communis]